MILFCLKGAIQEFVGSTLLDTVTMFPKQRNGIFVKSARNQVKTKKSQLYNDKLK